jgi:two-component system NarL family sensor kinase
LQQAKMDLTLRTITTVAACFALVLSILGAIFWRERPFHAGRGRRAIANLFYSLCLLLFTLRPFLPDWIGVVGANSILAAAAILSLEATREYRGFRPRAFPAYAAGILAVLAVVYFEYVVKNLNARVFAMSAFMGVVMMFCSVTLLKATRPKRTLGVSFSGGMFAFSAALLMARAIYFLFAPPLTDLFAPSWVNGAFFLGCVLSIVCCSIGWSQLVGEQLVMDLRRAESRTSIANREAAEGRRATAMVSEMNAVMREEIEERRRAEEELRRKQAQLITLPAALVQAHEAERRMLARELHDNFVQTLAALRMEASALPESSFESPDAIGSPTRDLAKNLAKKIGGLATDIHRMSQQLHPAILDHLGLKPAIDEVCTSFSERSGIPVRFEAAGVPRSLPGDIASCLFRVAQESLDNIEKHAAAKEVSVRLASDQAGLSLLLKDIGNGFDIERARGNGGLGLIRMEERVRLVGGRLSIQSQPGEGTSVTAFVPLHEGSISSPPLRA